MYKDESTDRILRLFLSAKDVTPGERHKLRHLIRHYMKMKHPFTACYRDNVKRFGPERAKKVCAVLKDLGTGTTKWRKGRQTANMSETIGPTPYIDDRIAEILIEAYETKDYKQFFGH